MASLNLSLLPDFLWQGQGEVQVVSCQHQRPQIVTGDDDFSLACASMDDPGRPGGAPMGASRLLSLESLSESFRYNCTVPLSTPEPARYDSFPGDARAGWTVLVRNEYKRRISKVITPVDYLLRVYSISRFSSGEDSQATRADAIRSSADAGLGSWNLGVPGGAWLVERRSASKWAHRPQPPAQTHTP